LHTTIITLIFFDLSILHYKEKSVNTISNKTYNATPSTIEKKWVLVDAADEPLGRLSSRVASILRGKNKPEFTPHMDAGDNVVVINAEKALLTGKKMTNKLYFRHTGYPGGEKFTSAKEMLEKDPTSLVRTAVKGMLPKNKLGRKLITNLRIYAGPVHPHIAQQPEIKEI
jgi:large subunit ribosomal protein L13